MLAARKKRLLIAFVSLIATVAVFLTFRTISRRAEGPVYGDRTLEDWIEQYWASQRQAADAENEEKNARIAIHAIGTNGIPFLLKWMDYEESDRKATARENVENLLYRVVHRFGISLRIENPLELRGDQAGFALAALGTNAQSALPEVTRMFNAVAVSPKDRAGHVLRGLGDDGVKIFTASLTNENEGVRNDAVIHLGAMEQHALPAIPALIRSLEDTDGNIAANAASALGHLKLEPALCVQALSKSLQSNNEWIRYCAAAALGEFGTNARPAIPLLLKASAETNDVRRSARIALSRIDPDIYTNLPDKEKWEE